MIFGIGSGKGGVGKTTTAVHIAGLLAERGKTLLIDYDKTNRSALTWAAQGRLPFQVVAVGEPFDPNGYQHFVIDAPAGSSSSDLRDLAKGCDQMVLVASPDQLALNALLLARQNLEDIPHVKALITLCPPPTEDDAREAKAFLEQQAIPQFQTQIRRLKAYSKAVIAGTLVFEVKDDARAKLAWLDYVNLGKELGL